MPMSNSKVEEAFQFYLGQTQKIEDACAAKESKSRSGNTVYSIKDNGREFSRPSINSKREVDHALHTCGKKTYPDDLEPDYSASPYWYEHIDWKEDQLRIVFDFVRNVEWNFDILNSAVKASKGLWHKYLIFQANDSLPHIDRLTSEGNALRLLNPEIDSQIEEILDLPEFKKMKSKYEYGEEQSGSAISITIDILDFIKPEQFPPGIYEEIIKEREREAAIPKLPTYETLNRNEKRFAISMKILEYFADAYYKCEHFSPVICVFCKNEFLPQCHNYWLFLTPAKYCDSCLGLCIRSDDSYMFYKNPVESIKDLALLGISEFFDRFGFVPAGNYSRSEIIRDFQTLEVPENELAYALKVLSLIPATLTVNELFGSWAHFLNLAGMLESSNRGKGGYRSIASDGHLCLSLGERAICEFLSREGLVHSKEPLYPKDKELNPNNLLRADFLVSGTYVEFAGRMQNEDYAKRMRNKELLANSHKLRWLKLESTTRSDLEELKSFIVKGIGKQKTKTKSN